MSPSSAHADRDEVVLVYPPTGWEDPRVVLPPLSLLTLVPPLREVGLRATVLDVRKDPAWRRTLEDRIATGRVLAVGISSMTGPQIHGGLDAARVTRAADPSVPIVWGGVHASLVQESTLRHALVDAIVVGEGDRSLPALACALRDTGGLAAVPGVGVLDDSHRPHVEPEPPRTPLDEMALPQYDAVDLTRYRSTLFGTPATSLPFVTSRGCPYRCTYCYNRVFDKRRWRAMSAPRARSAFEEIHQRYGARDIFLLDDEFFIDIQRVRQFAEEMRSSTVEFRFHNANCRVGEVLRFTADDLSSIVAAGFRQMFVGVESGNDEVLDRMEKDHTVADVLEANRRLATTDLVPAYSFMAGLPFERVDQVHDTLHLMERLVRDNPNARILPLSIYSPFPGTPLFETCLSMGFTAPEDLEGWTRVRYDRNNFPGFTADDSRFIEDAHYLSGFLDGRTFRTVSMRFAALRGWVGAVVRLRARHRLWRVRPLMALRRWLRQRSRAPS
ncbi:MAG: B12-binding domain-containing radical SAM protein [Polyangiaceae bacterium]|nr:B12-binding domain-containing radical SAM protein [Polyangiaceae bacterium]